MSKREELMQNLRSGRTTKQLLADPFPEELLEELRDIFADYKREYDARDCDYTLVSNGCYQSLESKQRGTSEYYEAFENSLLPPPDDWFEYLTGLQGDFFTYPTFADELETAVENIVDEYLFLGNDICNCCVNEIRDEFDGRIFELTLDIKMRILGEPVCV